MGDLAKVLEILGITGLVGLVILLVFGYIFYQEKVDQALAKLLSLFYWSGSFIRKRSLEATIQGDINDFRRDFNHDVAEAIPFAADLQFVKEVDRAELDVHRQTVIVRIRDRRYSDQNLVRAMLVFCTRGVIPQARNYLDPCLREAIDFLITRKLLAKLKHYSALNYLETVALPEACSATDDLQRTCLDLETLDAEGLFTRVVLAELRDFGIGMENRSAQTYHADEARALISYMLLVAKRAPGQDMAELGYLGEHLSVAVAFIGKRQRIQHEGLDPYLYHLILLQEAGFKKVYLQAWGDAYEPSAIKRAMRTFASRARNDDSDDEDAEIANDEVSLPSLDDLPEALSIRTAKEIAAEAIDARIAGKSRNLAYPRRDHFPEHLLWDHILIELELLPASRRPSTQ